MHNLGRISRILEQNQEVCVETNISVLLAFLEQILTYVNHAAAEVMISFCENICHFRIGFEHEVVDDEKRSLLTAIQNVHVGHAFDKFDTVGTSEQFLVTTEALNYPLWGRMNET